MGLLDANQESTDTALRVMASRPLEPETPVAKHSAWTTIPRALAASAAEIGGNIVDVAGAYGQVSAAMGQNASPFMPDSPETRKQRLDAYDKIKTEGIDWRTDEGQSAYSFARDLRPDPMTAGAAENVVFALTKGLSKAIGAGMLLGPAGGAGVFGASEGMTTAEDLAVQGVDQDTRTKAGAVVGAVNAVGMALPVAGKTLAQTAGLVAVGGPASFIAQQQAVRTILENADYGKIAQQYDPLDPTGLALSFLLPAGFATWAKSGAIMASVRSKGKAGKPAAEPMPAEPAATPHETVTTQAEMDAAMVHNLTIARDAHEDGSASGIQALHEAQLSSDAMPDAHADSYTDIRGNTFDTMFEGYEKTADDLTSMLDAMGFDTRRESSRVSMSEYIYAKTPDYLENDIGDVVRGQEIKFRLSNHTLPSSYEQANFDVAVFEKDMLRGDVGGDITEALRYAAKKAKIEPSGEAKALIEARTAREETLAKAEADRKAAVEDVHQSTLNLAHDFVSRQPDGVIIGVSKRGRMTATLDGKIIETLDTFPRDWASGTQAAKGQAPKMGKEESIAFLEGKGAVPANSRELGSQAPEGAGMKERPAVRADESGSLEEPAQSGIAGDGGDNVIQKVGAGKTAPNAAETPISLPDVSLSELRIANARDFDAVMAQIRETKRRIDEAAASGLSISDYLAKAEGVPPEVNNLLLGIEDAGGNQAGIDMLFSQYAEAVKSRGSKPFMDVAADVVDAARVNPPAEYPRQPIKGDPNIASMLNRVDSLAESSPDMPVAVRDDGTHARLADELEALRREAREGTDTELGADDAQLLQVAAECALSIGAAA